MAEKAQGEEGAGDKTKVGGEGGVGEGTPKPDQQAKPVQASQEKPAGGEKSSVKDGAPDPGIRRHAVKDDDSEIPGDAELLELTPKALKSRLDRHSKKGLRDRFGTDDPEVISARLKRLEELEAKEEETRKAQLSETERLKEEKQRAEARAEAAEQRAMQVEEDRAVDGVERQMSGLLSKHFDPDYVDDQASRLARHLATCSDRHLRPGKLEATVTKWCEEELKRKPKLAKESAESEPKKVALSNGAEDGKPKPALGTGENGKKTYAPGKANSMTDEEWRKEKRALGFTY